MTDAAEEKVRAHLDQLGIEHEIVPCDPELADTAAFCAAYGYAPEESANTIVVVGKSDPPRYVACVVLATTRLDVNRTVRTRLGVKKASFADPEQTKAITGMLIGGVTALGLPEDLPIWVDERVVRAAPHPPRRRQPVVQGHRPADPAHGPARGRGRPRPGAGARPRLKPAPTRARPGAPARRPR